MKKLFPAIVRAQKGSKQIATDGIFLWFADYTCPADPYRKNNFGFFTVESSQSSKFITWSKDFPQKNSN